MCSHEWVKVNDVTACRKCGLTTTYDGKTIFDRKYPHIKSKKRKVKKK